VNLLKCFVSDQDLENYEMYQDDRNELVDSVKRSGATPRKLFGVREWEEFVNNLGKQFFETESVLEDTFLAKFEALVWLYIRFVLLAQQVPKKTVAKDILVRLRIWVLADREFGTSQPDYVPLTQKRRRSQGSAEDELEELMRSRRPKIDHPASISKSPKSSQHVTPLANRRTPVKTLSALQKRFG